MLGNKTLKAFVPTTDAKKAKAFYGGILGLTLLSEDNFALEYDSNGTLLRVALVTELKPQAFTIIGWNVPDIYTIIKSLNTSVMSCI